MLLFNRPPVRYVEDLAKPKLASFVLSKHQTTQLTDVYNVLRIVAPRVRAETASWLQSAYMQTSVIYPAQVAKGVS